LATFPPISWSLPNRGTFNLLLDTPHGLITNQQLEFKIDALGPSGKILSTSFFGEVTEPIVPDRQPKKVTVLAPESIARRRPPYELKYIKKDQWLDGTCWGNSDWTKDDAGSFMEPTQSAALTLLINEDTQLLKDFRQSLSKRKLDENTVKDRITRYTAHIAFHLYQMYTYTKSQRDAQNGDDAHRIPEDDELRSEINRVGTTLLKIMEVSR
jgi:hypothetical protein